MNSYRKSFARGAEINEFLASSFFDAFLDDINRFL